MPVILSTFVKTLDLPDGVSAEVAYNIDGIRIWKGGKWIGTISRNHIDDNVVDVRLKEILEDDRDHQRQPGTPGGGGEDRPADHSDQHDRQD